MRLSNLKYCVLFTLYLSGGAVLSGCQSVIPLERPVRVLPASVLSPELPSPEQYGTPLVLSAPQEWHEELQVQLTRAASDKGDHLIHDASLDHLSESSARVVWIHGIRPARRLTKWLRWRLGIPGAITHHNWTWNTHGNSLERSRKVLIKDLSSLSLTSPNREKYGAAIYRYNMGSRYAGTIYRQRDIVQLKPFPTQLTPGQKVRFEGNIVAPIHSGDVIFSCRNGLLKSVNLGPRATDFSLVVEAPSETTECDLDVQHSPTETAPRYSVVSAYIPVGEASLITPAWAQREIPASESPAPEDAEGHILTTIDILRQAKHMGGLRQSEELSALAASFLTEYGTVDHEKIPEAMKKHSARKYAWQSIQYDYLQDFLEASLPFGSFAFRIYDEAFESIGIELVKTKHGVKGVILMMAKPSSS